MAYKYTHDRLIIDEVEHGGLVIFKEPFAEVRRLEMDVDKFLEVMLSFHLSADALPNKRFDSVTADERITLYLKTLLSAHMNFIIDYFMLFVALAVAGVTVDSQLLIQFILAVVAWRCVRKFMPIVPNSTRFCEVGYVREWRLVHC